MMIFVDELTDLLWAADPVSGERLPVRREAVIAQLEKGGQRRAARLARKLPARDGVLVAGEIDALQIRVHCELQRLGEELQLPRRVAEWVLRFRQSRGSEPIRVVDVGCGLGYVVRWLAAYGVLGPGVELVGVDLNRALVERAGELAAAEGLRCRFVAGDALAPGVAGDDGRATVVISSGLLHHLPATALPGFFAAQRALEVAAFAHWDIDPGPWTTLGAWVFHRARMREPVSRHDGVLSARRAHVTARPERWEAYERAGRAALALYLPFGAVVLAALAGYAVLSWRRRFLATALILGPFTFARPLVAVAGVVLAARATTDLLVLGVAAAAVAAVLAVEPIQNRRWAAAATGTASRR
ncbi:class I SAM-dependent methyltransferase [Actinoplanes sp. NPDC049599]|uniref:class I SAM-dependent methyltransferase n=1 Tax=Actinoplanes sp. NPDC049599 TaxID=3363903 RepID=UPI0037A2931B